MKFAMKFAKEEVRINELSAGHVNAVDERPARNGKTNDLRVGTQ